MPAPEQKTGPWRNRLRRLAMAARIAGLIYQPLPDVALPPEPPPIVEVDRRDRRRKGTGTVPDREQPRYQLMARLGRLAARCRDESEAEAYIGALPTLAAHLAPGAATQLLASAPRLSRGLSDATRCLRAHPHTRGLVTALPAATRNAALRLERQVRAGHPVDSDTCARTLAEETLRVLR
jgi:hypothetical protein